MSNRCYFMGVRPRSSGGFPHRRTRQAPRDPRAKRGLVNMQVKILFALHFQIRLFLFLKKKFCCKCFFIGDLHIMIHSLKVSKSDQDSKQNWNLEAQMSSRDTFEFLRISCSSIISTVWSWPLKILWCPYGSQHIVNNFGI